MATIDKFPDEGLFDTLMNILQNTEIHQNASNRYYVVSESSDIFVTFLVRNTGILDVYVSATKPIIALSGSKLELSQKSKQKLFQQLSARVQNKPVKKITEDDFDKISSLLKQFYVGADIKKLKDISISFEHSLIEAFNDILGKEKHLSEKDIVNLRVFLSQKYADWIKADTQKTRQRNG